MLACRNPIDRIPKVFRNTPKLCAYLKSADLVSEYKEKNFVYYEINTTVFDELIIWVNQFGGKKR